MIDKQDVSASESLHYQNLSTGWPSKNSAAARPQEIDETSTKHASGLDFWLCLGFGFPLDLLVSTESGTQELDRSLPGSLLTLQSSKRHDFNFPTLFGDDSHRAATGIAQPEVPQAMRREPLIPARSACTGIIRDIEDEQSALVQVPKRCRAPGICALCKHRKLRVEGETSAMRCPRRFRSRTPQNDVQHTVTLTPRLRSQSYV